MLEGDPAGAVVAGVVEATDADDAPEDVGDVDGEVVTPVDPPLLPVVPLLGIVVVVVVVVVVVSEAAGAPNWHPETVRTEASVPVTADADVRTASNGVKRMKCTEPSPCWVPVALPKFVVSSNGPVPGDVRMKSHACCPSGTVRPRSSELPHRPFVVPLPVQVTVPLVSANAELSEATVSVVVAAIMAANVITAVLNGCLELPLIDYLPRVGCVTPPRRDSSVVPQRLAEVLPVDALNVRLNRMFPKLRRSNDGRRDPLERCESAAV
jgi:hypothetical protein